MRVLADVDEADVGKLKEGFEAETTVDASRATFRGRVQQVRLSPTSTRASSPTRRWSRSTTSRQAAPGHDATVR